MEFLSFEFEIENFHARWTLEPLVKLSLLSAWQLSQENWRVQCVRKANSEVRVVWSAGGGLCLRFCVQVLGSVTIIVSRIQDPERSCPCHLAALSAVCRKEMKHRRM